MAGCGRSLVEILEYRSDLKVSAVLSAALCEAIVEVDLLQSLIGVSMALSC